jgi:CubicO group peptidase (beta-lactamase class C family)
MTVNSTQTCDTGTRSTKALWCCGVLGLVAVAVTLAEWMEWSSLRSDEPELAAERGGTEARATTWPVADSLTHGLNQRALDDLAKLVGGAGFVAHQGVGIHRWGYDHRPRYAASVKKSLISVLNLQAVDKGLLRDVDDLVVKFEPRLAFLNGGKDSTITWRHLGCMTSGYGAVEAPGEAFAYSDYAVALWYDTLMDKVYQEKGTEVLRRQLAEPLRFEDAVTFQAFGPEGPEPKLRISARDLARFGQMIMDGGMAHGVRILSQEAMATLLGSVVPGTLPLSSGQDAEMLPGQKTVGGEMWNISPIGPGRYSFHFWMNRSEPAHLAMLPDAPGDTILASGKWGEAALWIIPSLELVVAWNGSEINDHHLARIDRNAKMNVAARLMVQAVTEPPSAVVAK